MRYVFVKVSGHWTFLIDPLRPRKYPKMTKTANFFNFIFFLQFLSNFSVDSVLRTLKMIKLKKIDIQVTQFEKHNSFVRENTSKCHRDEEKIQKFRNFYVFMQLLLNCRLIWWLRMLKTFNKENNSLSRRLV